MTERRARAVVLFLILPAFLYPFVAEASFLSMLGFGGTPAIAQEVSPVHNSQNIPLPEANVSIGSLDPKAIGGGDVMVEGNALVSDSGPLGTRADDKGDEISPDAVSLYVVKKGDTVGGIAHMFGVTTGTVRLANDLPIGASVHEGDTLLILPITGMQYTIKKGDTLQKIAKNTGGDAEEIGKFNGLEADSQLAVGDTIIVPDAELSAPAPVTTVARGKSNSGSSKGTKGLPKVAYGATALKSGTDKGPEYGGYYMCPVSSPVQTQGLHGWNGRDYGAPTGTPVYAAAGGTVIVARGSGWNSGYGDNIIINHENGTQTVYAHLSKVFVTAGQSVGKGDEIALVGRTGRATGPHLHFEVRGAQNNACGR